MTAPIKLCLLGGLGSALVTAAALPLWRAWCLRVGRVDDPGGRKMHDHPMPLAGGLAVLTGLLLPLLVLPAVWQWPLIEGAAGAAIQRAFSGRGAQLGPILAGAIGMFLLGWVDDRHELRAGVKFGGQLLVALLVAGAGVRVTLFIPSVLFSYAVTLLWILTVTNAFNFMDNMNGLCAGLAAIAAIALALNAASAQPWVTMLALLTCGALLGFLPYNFPRASAFLGDSGSHLAGYLLAVLAILPSFYSGQHPNRWAVLKPLLILAVPLVDLGWVVILRWRLGRPFYVGDANHLSHRLVRRGLGNIEAVLVLWLLGGVMAVLSLVF
jgi:UDP-GlcNAc:undecaprenyl-phosphate GlcNAc-1-phosphate transferase